MEIDAMGGKDKELDEKQAELRYELQSSGITPVDCSRDGGKEVADKMMLVDMFTYAIDNKHAGPLTIIAITGNRDYAYPLSVLRQRRYQVILISRPNAHPTLLAQASQTFNWEDLLAGIHPRTLSDGMIRGDKKLVAQASVTLSGSAEEEQYQARHSTHIDLQRAGSFAVGYALAQSISAATKNSYGQGERGASTVSPFDTSASGIHIPSAGIEIVPPPASATIPPPLPATFPFITSSGTGSGSHNPDYMGNQGLIVVPAKFCPLVKSLKRYRSRGVKKVLRIDLAEDIGLNAIKRAGFTKLRGYIIAAQEDALIELGGRDDGAWVMLRKEYHNAVCQC